MAEAAARPLERGKKGYRSGEREEEGERERERRGATSSDSRWEGRGKGEGGRKIGLILGSLALPLHPAPKEG